MATERYLTLLPAMSFPVEVEVDHYFVTHGKRYAVVYKMHHGEPIHYVREEAHLMPLIEETVADAA